MVTHACLPYYVALTFIKVGTLLHVKEKSPSMCVWYILGGARIKLLTKNQTSKTKNLLSK